MSKYNKEVDDLLSEWVNCDDGFGQGQLVSKLLAAACLFGRTEAMKDVAALLEEMSHSVTCGLVELREYLDE